jgi:hypothetical protein
LSVSEFSKRYSNATKVNAARLTMAVEVTGPDIGQGRRLVACQHPLLVRRGEHHSPCAPTGCAPTDPGTAPDTGQTLLGASRER